MSYTNEEKSKIAQFLTASQAVQQEKAREAYKYGAIQGTMVAAKAKQESPIMEELISCEERLCDLGKAIDDLTDSLLSIMNYDPRNEPVADMGANTAPASRPISCELHDVLKKRNEQIDKATRRLHEIRRLLCL